VLVGIAVVTCERRGGVSYLEGTLGCIDREGGVDIDERVVLASGNRPDVLAPWTVYHNRQKDGSRFNMWRAFERAVIEGWDRLLYFEDDIRLAKNAVRAAAAIELPPDVAFLDLRDVSALRGPITGCRLRLAPGLYKVPVAGAHGGWYSGTHALVIPRWTFKTLLEQGVPEWVPLEQHFEIEGKNAADKALGRAIVQMGADYYGATVPSLVTEHIGEVSAVTTFSTMGTKPTHQPPPGFDSMTLVGQTWKTLPRAPWSPK
jgi:hypothetical protein